jgi:maleate isomerase
MPSILDNDSEWNVILPEGVVMVFATLGVQDHIPEEFDRAAEKFEAAVHALAREKAGAIIMGGSPVLEYKNVKSEDQALSDKLTKATGVPCTTTRQAANEAMRALGIKRIVVATPWKDELNRRTKTSLEGAGFEVLRIEGLQIGPTVEIAMLPDYANYHLAREVFEKHPEADGILIPCARFPSVKNIEKLEHDCRVPVVTSTQAMIWWGLRKLNLREPIRGFGRLLEEKL